ncbi:hypothetical protein ACVILI_006786 [Mesorhizobium sp. USDA 4775]|uniref:hypothetical protein n=1 Tax=Mesorhizobium jarvisii TaxID=1777867 RepID=UPI001F0AA8BF|nr:hypothetical protein [Mesorhizobium jarvisii]MCH4561470.1 hypothetical protein [Mesorhizobium jarvisii]
MIDHRGQGGACTEQIVENRLEFGFERGAAFAQIVKMIQLFGEMPPKCIGELWRKMGDDGLRRAAYRGG